MKILASILLLVGGLFGFAAIGSIGVGNGSQFAGLVVFAFVALLAGAILFACSGLGRAKREKETLTLLRQIAAQGQRQEKWRL